MVVVIIFLSPLSQCSHSETFLPPLRPAFSILFVNTPSFHLLIVAVSKIVTCILPPGTLSNSWLRWPVSKQMILSVASVPVSPQASWMLPHVWPTISVDCDMSKINSLFLSRTDSSFCVLSSYAPCTATDPRLAFSSANLAQILVHQGGLW